jgi:hypothetical protein
MCHLALPKEQSVPFREQPFEIISSFLLKLRNGVHILYFFLLSSVVRLRTRFYCYDGLENFGIIIAGNTHIILKLTKPEADISNYFYIRQ